MGSVRTEFFVVIEGLDGSGKTEVSRQVKQTLQQTHEDSVLLTFEPHDPSCAGLFIRQVLARKIKNVNPITLALAFALNRADHNDRVIEGFFAGARKRDEPAVVICDRYYLSSLVYQSVPPLNMEDVMQFNERSRRPDLTIFLNVDTNTCYARMRSRPQDKELFEKNLTETRKKYQTAIEFLRKRGDLIVEVDANPPLMDVVNAILGVLRENGPDWLKIQRPLFPTSSDVFSLNDVEQTTEKIREIVGRFAHRFQQDPIPGGDTFLSALDHLRESVEVEMERLSFDDIGLLFLGYIQRWGYRLCDRLAWTETCAYALEYEMPLDITQRGTALLIGESQRFDLVTKKMMDLMDRSSDSSDIKRLSDFMFVLDAGRRKQIEHQIERDSNETTETISPTVRTIGRKELAGLVLIDILALYVEEHPDTFHANPALNTTLSDALEEWELKHYWENAVANVSTLTQ